MKYKLKILLLVLLLLSGFHFSSFAQFSSSEIKNLTNGADIILTGKVTQQTSSWNENKTRIYTKATIQVNEYIKGNNTQSTVTVNYLGGEVGEIGEMYSHMPSFEDNEEVLVFLKKDEKNTDYKVFSGEEGKITLLNNETTGEKTTNSYVPLNSLKQQIINHLNE